MVFAFCCFMEKKIDWKSNKVIDHITTNHSTNSRTNLLNKQLKKCTGANWKKRLRELTQAVRSLSSMLETDRSRFGQDHVTCSNS